MWRLVWGESEYGRRQLQPVERTFAGQRLAFVSLADTLVSRRIGLADEHRRQRIVPQFVVIVAVIVAEVQPEHALLNEVLDAVLDEIGIAMIREAFREPQQKSLKLRTSRRYLGRRPIFTVACGNAVGMRVFQNVDWPKAILTVAEPL